MLREAAPCEGRRRGYASLWEVARQGGTAVAVILNHTIVWCYDKHVSAGYLAGVLGLEQPTAWGPFMMVETSNGVSLDFHEIALGRRVTGQHYAFLVSEAEFDEIFARIEAAGQVYWADPNRETACQINRNDDGRGIYFSDPNGHLLEIITRPYGTIA